MGESLCPEQEVSPGTEQEVSLGPNPKVSLDPLLEVTLVINKCILINVY